MLYKNFCGSKSFNIHISVKTQYINSYSITRAKCSLPWISKQQSNRNQQSIFQQGKNTSNKGIYSAWKLKAMDYMDELLDSQDEMSNRENSIQVKQKQVQEQKPRKFSLYIQKKEAQKAIQWKYVNIGREILITVMGVGALTQAYKNGVRPGCILREIAHPDGKGEIIPILGAPYSNFIHEAVNTHRDQEISMTFELPTDNMFKQIEDFIKQEDQLRKNQIQKIQQQTQSNKSKALDQFDLDQSNPQTLAEENKITNSQDRIEARKEYLKEVGGRNDTNYLLGVFLLVFLPPFAILVIAKFSGFLDIVYQKSLNLN